MAYRGNPDDALVVIFKHHPKENELLTREEGRPIFDDEEVCEVRAPGSRDVKVFPANFFSRWVDDPETGRPVKQSYAERFSYQYIQFKKQATQTKIGTPLEHAPFLTEGKRAELKAQNVYTVEALAIIEGNELKNLGPGGRDLKNQAEAYIEESKSSAPNKQMVAELEALKARNAILEEDVHVLKAKKKSDEAEFENMSDEQLREFIKTNTGSGPVGQPARKTLVRMAMECRVDEKVA
jgi:hypothetical protein